MRRDPIRLSAHHRAWLHGTFGVLFLSGALWLGLHYFGVSEAEFGPQTHPLESWSLRAHGAAAMLFLIILGTLLRGHVRGGWKLRRNRFSGAVLVTFNALLVLSGYGLYYFGGEQLRHWVSRIHWLAGLIAPPVVLWHICLGKISAGKTHSLKK